MSRLPLDFAGRPISFRIPYNISGEMDVAPNQSGVVYPEATFLHNVDKPFEIHRTIIRLTAKNANGVILEPQPTTLDERIRLRITDFSKNENLTKVSTLVQTLVNAFTKTWELEEPYTLVRSEGLQVQVDSLAYPSICQVDGTAQTPCIATPIFTPVAFVRVEVNFQGYLLVVAPPSETR